MEVSLLLEVLIIYRLLCNLRDIWHVKTTKILSNANTLGTLPGKRENISTSSKRSVTLTIIQVPLSRSVHYSLNMSSLLTNE